LQSKLRDEPVEKLLAAEFIDLTALLAIGLTVEVASDPFDGHRQIASWI
jgi:hypothetical protein